MTMLAPKRMLLAMSPWLRMPPSAMSGLGRHAGAPFHGAELPAAGAERFELGDADLARAHTHLGGIGTQFRGR